MINAFYENAAVLDLMRSSYSTPEKNTCDTVIVSQVLPGLYVLYATSAWPDSR